LAKILPFYAETTVSCYKNLIITLVFDKNANFIAENWQKSQKIVIIASTPGTDVIIFKIFLTEAFGESTWLFDSKYVLLFS
jgi:hypothetical protein